MKINSILYKGVLSHTAMHLYCSYPIAHRYEKNKSSPISCGVSPSSPRQKNIIRSSYHSMDSVGITRKCTKLLSFDQMAREGVKATMISSFPSKTFPNHYTMATGLVPDHHGIVANSFWDPERKEVYKMNKPATRNDASYYGGEPIWVTAQKQGIKTGNVYWVGSDIAVKGEHPTYYQVYDKKPLSLTNRTGGRSIAHAPASGSRSASGSLCSTLKIQIPMDIPTVRLVRKLENA